MALATYADLQASIVEWLINDNLASRAPDFIALAESEINKRLAVRPVRPMQGISTASITGEYIAHPTDMLAPDSFLIDGTQDWRVTYVTPEQMAAMKYDETRRRAELVSLWGGENAPPEYYTIVGTDFRFYPTPQTTFAAELTYWRRLPALSNSNTANWLLTAFPDTYLYGSLAVASGFTDEPKEGAWQGLFTNAIDGVLSAYPKPPATAPLRADIPQARYYGGWR